MKYILLFLISFYAHASFINIDKCLSGGGDVFSSKKLCESESSGECAEYPGGNCAQFDSVEIIGDLKDQPLYSSASEIEECIGEEACRSALMLKKCTESVPYINQEFSSIYCSAFIGYAQGVIGHSLVVNQSKLDAYNSAQNIKMQLEAGMAAARKAQDCGRDTMAYMLVRNAAKTLTTTQVKQLVSNTSSIKSLLESGSLESAKEEISSTLVDGVLITESDKTALLLFINGCK